MSLKSNLLKNGIASILQKGIRILEQLFLVPFFITAWGAAYYGEWLTLTIIPSIIAFSDFGFGTAAANSFVLSYAAGDHQKAANINKTGLMVITLMILAVMLISSIVLYVCNEFHVFEKSLINSYDAIIAVSILILARLLNFYTQLFQAYFRAAQKAAMSINWLTLKAGLNLLAGLCVLLLGYGVVAFSLSQLIVIVIFNLTFAYNGKITLELFRNFRGKVDPVELKSIAHKGVGYLVSPLWQAIYFQGTTFIVRIVLGPEAVTIFNTLRTLSRSINQIFFLTKTTVFPELQFEIGRGEMNRARKLYRMSVFGVFSMALVGFIFLVLFGLPLYHIWTKNEFSISPLLWYIFISGMLLNALWWTAEMIFAAMNKPNKFAIFGLVSALVSTGLTYVLSLNFGLNGAAIGSVSLDVLMVLIALPFAAKMLNMGTFDFIKHGASDFKGLYLQSKKRLQLILNR